MGLTTLFTDIAHSPNPIILAACTIMGTIVGAWWVIVALWPCIALSIHRFYGDAPNFIRRTIPRPWANPNLPTVRANMSLAAFAVPLILFALFSEQPASCGLLISYAMVLTGTYVTIVIVAAYFIARHGVRQDEAQRDRNVKNNKIPSANPWVKK